MGKQFRDDETFNDTVREMAVDVAELVMAKQHDYGPKNILNCPVGAEIGVIVRLSDKLARFSHLYSQGNLAKNESLDDTVDDIIGYGLVLKMVRAGKFELPLVDEDADE